VVAASSLLPVMTKALSSGSLLHLESGYTLSRTLIYIMDVQDSAFFSFLDRIANPSPPQKAGLGTNALTKEAAALKEKEAAAAEAEAQAAVIA
jgi:hypothetical protein